MAKLSHPWNTLWNLSSNFRKKREIRRPMYLWRCNQVNGCTTLHILHIAHIAAKLLHVNWHCCYLPTNCLLWLILNARVYIHHQLNWVIHFGQPTVPVELHPATYVCTIFDCTVYVHLCLTLYLVTAEHRRQDTGNKLETTWLPDMWLYLYNRIKPRPKKTRASNKYSLTPKSIWQASMWPQVSDFQNPWRSFSHQVSMSMCMM